MSVVIEEKFESRRVMTGPNATAELRYNIFGTDDDAEARLQLLAATEPTFDLYDNGTVLLNREYVGIEPVGPGHWDGVAYYTRTRATGQQGFRFDTTGGMQHITQSIATSGRFPANADDFKGAIGVGDAGPEGVDISVPVFNFLVPRFIPTSAMTPNYVETIYGLTARVNNGTFAVTLPCGLPLSFAANEVLFIGARGSERTGMGDFEVEFGFAASPNLTNLTVGEITGILKAGWDYLWVRYKESQDTATGRLVMIPRSVHVEQVYRFGNLSALGIV